MTLEMVLAKQVHDLKRDKAELLQALTEIVESWDEETAYFNSIGLTSDKKDYIEKARDVLAKFEGAL